MGSSPRLIRETGIFYQSLFPTKKPGRKKKFWVFTQPKFWPRIISNRDIGSGNFPFFFTRGGEKGNPKRGWNGSLFSFPCWGENFFWLPTRGIYTETSGQKKGCEPPEFSQSVGSFFTIITFFGHWAFVPCFTAHGFLEISRVCRPPGDFPFPSFLKGVFSRKEEFFSLLWKRGARKIPP